MSTREITLRAFCSAKGGVGKTTLALASAYLLRTKGRRPVVIDADLTGTSLADGLHLCAPDLPRRPDKSLDLKAAPLGYLDLTQTRSRRRDRGASKALGVPVHLPYLNDALAYERRDPEGECRIDAMLWHHQVDDGVLYLPSSALPEDAAIALGWLYGQDDDYRWIQRLCWLMDELAIRLKDITDIIIDLAPGLLGFTRLTLVMMHHLYQNRSLPAGYPEWGGETRWIVRPFLIMTPDRNDWLAALHAYGGYRAGFLVPIVNRARSGAFEAMMQEVRDEFGDIGLDKAPQDNAVEEMPDLSDIFRSGNLHLSKRIEGLCKPLRVE